MPDKFHLAQFSLTSVTHHSMATWKHPRNLQGGWAFRPSGYLAAPGEGLRARQIRLFLCCRHRRNLRGLSTKL